MTERPSHDFDDHGAIAPHFSGHAGDEPVAGLPPAEPQARTHPRPADLTLSGLSSPGHRRLCPRPTAEPMRLI